MKTNLLVAAAVLTAVVAGERSNGQAQEEWRLGPLTGWLSWRGPAQNGTSTETGLPDTWSPGDENQIWTLDLSGRGTPVIAEGRVYTGGYTGDGAALQEVLVCLDERDGSIIWERRFNDFLSDVIYNRYSIGSPTIDPATGNVYYLTAAGLLNAFTRDGDPLWQRTMMEDYGRLTFPNGRTGSPVIDDDLVIIHSITANWGNQGPARDRFFAFDKRTGEMVWGSTPGVVPKDNSFSMPVLAWENGRRVLYAGTGCGNLVCVDVRTGEPIWRFQMSIGGINSAAVLTDDRVIALHGRENLDASGIGRMIALPRGLEPPAGTPGPRVLANEQELWRNDLSAFSSSPVLVGNRVYQTDHTGELACVDVDTGKVLWKQKLAPDQIHASPLYADGKLYVPMNNGTFYVIRPTDAGPEILSEAQLEGNCLGAPSAWNSRVYVHTTEKLYCFGRGLRATKTFPAREVRPTSSGPATQLQVVPCDVVVRRGERVPLLVRGLDARGQVVSPRVTGATPASRGSSWSFRSRAATGWACWR
ncbi:MAG: outer membrane protein assembly factor BamB family protein [Planctomycetota bacterium]|jgi:outer membrane protein assembly factor BamB